MSATRAGAPSSLLDQAIAPARAQQDASTARLRELDRL